LLHHNGSSKLKHSENQQEKHGRNDGELDDSRASSDSSASSAIPL
jgi:hypothetical protein